MTANALIMCEPGGRYGFYSDAQTGATNSMQKNLAMKREEIQEWAWGEWKSAAFKLRDAGIEVQTFLQGNEDTPNAIFPNNWFSVNPESGLCVLYPMLTASRRKERNSCVTDLWPIQLDRLDLTSFESQDRALEGTGSLVLDRAYKVAYACLSPRTDALLAQVWAQKLGYDLFTFSASGPDEVAYYHTNVMMAIGTHWAVICLESIESESDRIALRCKIEETGKILIPITRTQVAKFCGNILEVKNRKGEHILLMSKQASENFSIEQFALLKSFVHHVVAPDIGTIEHVGGGGMRCMVAENFV
jgi:hypothetical protein